MALVGPQPRAFTWQLLRAWLVIVGVVAIAVQLHSVWASVIAILVVATRQNVLGLLVHEQTHLLGYRGKFGDLLVNLFAGYPLLLLTVEGYARVHLVHHRDYFGPTDPDHRRKSGHEWNTPRPGRELARLFLFDLIGVNTLKLIRGKRSADETKALARKYIIPRWVRPLYFALAAALLTLTGGWEIFLLYWVLPLLTVTQVLVRWGALCEHKYNLAGATVADSTPLILLGVWERLLMPNLNFGMHPYHHYFPGVAFSNLPKVHDLFVHEGLVDDRNVFHGYAEYLRHVTGKAEQRGSTPRRAVPLPR